MRRTTLFSELSSVIIKNILIILIILKSVSIIHAQCNITVTPGSTTIVSPATIYDPGGTANYGNNLNSVTTYTAPAGYRLVINFTSFNTESGYDFMWLYDAANASGTEKIKVSGTSLPSPASHTSTGQSFTIKFTSDGSVTASGYVATLTCLASCSNTTGGGSISGNQSLCGSYDPTTITSLSAASGGSGGTTYQWESSLNNSTWTEISGATALTYDPPTISQTTYYRRKSKSSSCSVWGAATTSISKVVASNITLGTPTVSAVIDQPLTDIVTVDVVVSWSAAAPGQKINVSYNNKTKYIDVPSGTTSPQTIRFLAYADNTSGNTISATWESTTGCTSTATFATPAPLSNPQIACNVLYLCGEDKPWDGYPFDHGLIDYFDLVTSGTLTPVLTKNEAGLGLYDANSPTTPVTVNFNNYNLIVVSPTTEGHLSTSLKELLAGYSGSILEMNYDATMALGMTSGGSLVGWGTDFATSTSVTEQITDYGNVNPNYGYLMTAGDYKSNGTPGGLWLNTTAATNNNGGVLYSYNAHSLSGVSTTHGNRVYFGLHMNGLYANAQNGGALPVPATYNFVPTNHLTQKGKLYLDNAILLAAKCTAEICNNGIDDDGDGLADCYDPDCGQITNREFDNGTTDWWLAQNSTAVGTFTVDNTSQVSGLNSAKVNVTTSTGTDWHIQLGQNGKTIEAGKTYRLSFAAKASANRTITSLIQLSSSPWTGYASQTHNLTTGVTNFSYTFTATTTVLNNISVVFNTGIVTGTVYIDDVRFEETCGTFVCPVNSCTSSNLVTNPSLSVDLSGWSTSNGNLEIGTGGTYGQFMVLNNPDYASNYYVYQDVTFAANALYKFTGYAAKHPTGSNAKVYLEFYNGSTFISKTSDFFVTFNYNGSFQTITPFEGTTPPGTTKIRVVGFCNGTALKLDELQLYSCIPGPTVSMPSANLCLGSTMTLSPTTGGTWTSSNTAVATITNAGVVTPVAAGTVTFTFTQTSNLCASTTNTLTVSAKPTVSITGATTICVGGTTTLSPTTGGTWSSSNTAVATVTNAGVVTAVAAGTATFTFTQTSSGCVSNATAAITVNARPTVSITGASTICVGSTTSLSPTTGGTWASSNTAVATVTNAGVVTGVAAGTATFTFTQTSTGCASIATAAITVNARPTVSITGASTICVGATTALSPTSGGTWTSSNTAVATVTNAGVVTGVASGTATFTFTQTSTGCVSNATSVITINALPSVSITGTSTICAGATTTLSPTTGGTWTSSNTAVATVTNAGVVTGVSAGTATFTFTQTSTGCVSNATAAVTVNAKPSVSITGASSICVGSTTTLSPTTGGTWTSSNTAVATVTNAGVVTAVASGTATFTFTQTSTGCVSNATAAVTVNAVPSVSITGASTICAGATTTLSPTTGGTWTSSNTAVATVTNAGLVTGVASGTATFTFTQTSTGCPSNATSAITVNAKPTVAITGASDICIGTTTTLSPTTGGTWASSNTAVATVTNAGVVTGVAVGSATFTFTQTSTGCVSNATTAITVTTKPSISITGASSICIGGTTTLSPTTGGTWSSSNTAVATVTNAGVVTAVSTGTATFTFTQSGTSCSSDPSGAITINAKPSVSITGATTICVGATTTLSPTTGGTWASSNTAVATVTNAGVVTGVSSGSATFTFTQTSTGCPSDATAAVIINGRPSVSITGASSICIGGTTTLSPSTGGTWTSSNTAVATVTNAGVVTAVTAGTATFTFTQTSTGCTSNATSTITINAKPTVSITGASAICIGTTTTLSPTTGGTWSSSNTAVATVTNAGVVTGVAAGTATFTFTQTSTGCPSDATSAVTINGKPSTNITGANTTLCVGATTNVSPTTGGTWVSSNTAVATITNTGVITAVGAGTATFTYTLTSTSCASDATAPFTINAKPSVSITGGTSICIGSNSTLSPTSGGTWTSSNTSIATVTNAGVVTGVAAGTATFTFTQSSNSCVSNPTSAITVGSKPTTNITGANTSLCIGGTTTISPTTGGTWSSSNAAVATITNAGVITAIGAGTATFTYTLSGGGCTSDATAPFTVNAKPSISITGTNAICIGNTTTLSPTTGGAWTSSNNSIATVTNAGVVTGVSAGTATFTFTQTSTGCSSDASSSITINEKPTTDITSANTNLCIGATTSIIPNSGGTWTSSNTSVATITNAGVITAISTGTVNFTFTLTSTGCISDATANFTVNVKPTVSITGGSSICVGGTTTLSPSSGGTWASSNAAVATVTNGGLVTGISNGSATFIFTQTGNGCASDATPSVSVVSKPTVSILGSNTICIGSTTTLSPSSGGTWTSSNASIATVTNGGLVTGISGGSVTFTFTNSGGCVSDATSTVNVSPAMNANINYNGSVCLTTNSLLTAVASGGTSPFTYNWTGPSGYTSNSQNASITLNGNYALTITDSYGCPATTTGFVYARYEPLIVTLSTTICEGQSVNLNLNAQNAVSYLWGSNAGNSTAASVTVFPAVPSSTYIVTVTNDQGCTGSASATINVTPKPIVSITGGGTICEGQTTQLSPNSGGSWVSSNNGIASVTNAGLVTGISVGSATFTFTQTSTGCVSNQTPAVTVLAKPTVSIVGPSSICKLSTTQLSPSTGGTWVSSNSSVATVNNSGLVTGISAGTAYFTFTSSNGCVSNATGTITVDDNVGVTLSGSNNVCVGQTTIVSASNSSGTWSSSNTSVATINSSGLVTGISAGTATITYNSNSGSCVNQSTHSITVSAIPTVSITGSNIICAQATSQLSPSSGGTWTSSNTAIATVTNTGLVTGIASGSATFTFTSTEGCASNPTTAITVNNKPTATFVGPSTICLNSSSQMNPSSGGTWTSSNSSVATITSNGTITGIGVGTATFTFTSSNGCVSNASSTLTVTTKPNLSIDYNGSVCLTNDSKLTAVVSGGTLPYTYNWTGPQSFTGSTQQVSIINNGNYAVTVSDANGCVVNASGFVYEKFEPFVVSLQTKVCEGQNVTLNANTSSAVSYLWSSNANSATTSSVTVTPTLPSSTYTVTITNTLGCSATAVATITVDPKPIVTITGGATICQGATTTLSPTSGGTWISNNPSVATVTNSGLVTAVATGSTTFVFTNSTTGCSSNNSPVVTVSDKPSINYSGPSSICINGTTNLIPSSGGTWTSNNPGIATINNSGLVTAIAPGIATFTFVSNASNCSSASSTPLTVQNKPSVSITGDDIICAGFTTTLSPTSGGTWASNNPTIATVSNSGIVTGLTTGTATFTFTNTSGCPSNATNPITVNGKPTIAFSGPTSVCVGGTSSITPSNNGIWTSSNTAIATISNTGLITSISPGSVTFTYTSGNTGCISDPSTSFVVNGKPTVSITGSSSLCIGSTTTLSPSTGGTWTSNNPSIASVTNSGIVTAISDGTATFYFTNSTTTCTSANTTPVVVYSKPTVSITGANTLCIGGTTTLSPSSGGSWTSNNPSVASVTNSGIVLGLSQGTATFTYTETNSGCTSNPSLPVSVNSKPIVSISGPTAICIGGVTTLMPTTGGTWTSSNNTIATVTNAGIVTGHNQGSVTFTFTSNTGCSSNPTNSIEINGKPSILITGPNQICVGSTTTISPSTGGSWVSNNPTVATISNTGVITGIANGTATFKFTDQNTGCTSDNSAPLQVNENPTITNLGSNHICIGTTTNLAPTTGGIWTSSNNAIAEVSASGVVLGISEGTANFTYTNSATGCVSNAALSVIVNPKPVISITGSSSICVGATTTMSPTSGGTWTSKNPTIASINASGVVTGIAQGVARFTFTNSTTGCVSNNSAPVLINGAPSTSLTGPSQLCVGSTSQLSPTIGGTWVSEQPSIASVTNTGMITALAPGTATFVFTETASGCSSPSGQNMITVTTPDSPTILGESTICLNYQTFLSPSMGVIWTSSNPKIATVSNDGVVTGHAPGKVSFTYTLISTGCSASLPLDAITVKNCVDPDFNVTISNIQLKGNVSTNDEVPVGTTWGQAMLISKPSGSIATITINPDGTYTFIGNTKGQYVYNVPVCIAPLIYACPSSQLIITVLDPLDSGNKNIANLDLATVYTGDSIWMNALSNDKCLNSTNCILDEGSMSQINTNINGSSHVGDPGGFMFTPTNNAIGLDTIIYKICVDGEPTNCIETKQYIVINASNAPNSTVASDDFMSTYAGVSVSGDLTGNDTDPEEDAQNIVPQGSASAKINLPEGKYYIESNGVLHFEPAAGFVGAVDIVYTICDDNAIDPQCVKATAHVLVMGDMSVNIRVYLEGALMANGDQLTPDGKHMMRDDLRVNPFDGQNYIPVKDPYKFNAPNINISGSYEYVATGTMARYSDPLDSLAVFSVTGRNAIVDWVFVELRSKADYKTVVASRSALLQRDGDVVDVDGISSLKFAQITLDSFYVVVRHRNHLGVMSQLVANGNLVDFTLPSTPVFDFGTSLNNGMDYTGLAMNGNVKYGYMALWAGDFDANRKLKFTNPSDDQNTLFFDVFAHVDNTSGNANYNNAIGYYQGDFNMNGKSKYDNPNDDKNLLFSQILLYPLNTQYLSNFDFFIEQVPK